MTEIVLPKVRNAGVKPLFTGPEWNFELLREAYDAIAEVGLGEMGLDMKRTP